MRVFIVTYLCSVVGVYSCAVDAQQCIRVLKRVGSRPARKGTISRNVRAILDEIDQKIAAATPSHVPPAAACNRGLQILVRAALKRILK